MDSGNEPEYIRYLHTKAAQIKMPVSGTFELTARCNFNCAMCYVHCADINSSGKSGELSASQWLDIADEACGQGMLFLLLTGGEPLIRDDFDEIYCKIREKGVLVSVNTNGFFLSEEIMAAFRKHIPKRINVSLYGSSQKTYTELCGTDAYDRVRENIIKLKKEGFSVKLNMPITELNKNDVSEVKRFSSEYGIPLQATGYVFPPARSDKSCAYRISAEESAEFDLSDFSADSDKLRQYAEKTLSASAPWNKGVMCRAGRSAFWITWDGRMLPCGMMNEEGISVVEHGFIPSWEHVMRQTESITLPEKCFGCKYRCVCSVCAAKCTAETGGYSTAPEYLCQIAQRKYMLLKNAADGMVTHENQ